LTPHDPLCRHRYAVVQNTPKLTCMCTRDSLARGLQLKIRPSYIFF
jgi:hypothetical protein